MYWYSARRLKIASEFGTVNSINHDSSFNKNWLLIYGSVPVDFLRPKFRVAHTKHDVISILMNKYTYINMYIIKKIISCIFILCWDITALLKLKWKFAGYV